jgi:short subunit dehydrogenase-like uncharacterized protein
MRAAREFDVVLYGASGFVGRQTIAHFAQHAGRLRWAVAGRNEARLHEALGEHRAAVIVADAADAKALARLAARTRVVLSTAGPFARFGSALVAACVKHQTHYCDITGETPWVRDVIDRHHAQAARDGTRIVPCCGFDSVPSDIGTLVVASALRRTSGEPCVSVRALHSMRGGLNGGTLASILNIAASGRFRQLADPFLLNPEGTAPADRRAHADVMAPRYEDGFGAWSAPFVMAAINTRVVRRSAALLRDDARSPYGEDFVYQETLRTGRGAKGAALAAGMSLGLGAGAVGLRLAPWRALVERLLPAPGAGPSESAMDGGWFRCELIGRNASGRTLRGRVSGQGDPGNRATTVFVCEAAMALAGDARRLPGGSARGGVLTPATALGLSYAKRLVQAGMAIEPLPA